MSWTGPTSRDGPRGCRGRQVHPRRNRTPVSSYPHTPGFTSGSFTARTTGWEEQGGLPRSLPPVSRPTDIWMSSRPRLGTPRRPPSTVVEARNHYPGPYLVRTGTGGRTGSDLHPFPDLDHVQDGGVDTTPDLPQCPCPGLIPRLGSRGQGRNDNKRTTETRSRSWRDLTHKCRHFTPTTTLLDLPRRYDWWRRNSDTPLPVTAGKEQVERRMDEGGSRVGRR